jgi:hypothetical protein
MAADTTDGRGFLRMNAIACLLTRGSERSWEH